jgi:fumarate reductase (CoM/CoB) subunit A
MILSSIPHVETDILVIGAGIGGMRAAIGACDNGVKVTIVTQGALGRDGAASWMAGGTFQAAADSRDSVENHVRDTIAAGKYINNQKVVYNFLKHCPQMLKELDGWGFGLRKQDGKYIQGRLPGTSFPRSCELIRDGTLGNENRRIIPPQVRNREIDIVEDHFVSELLIAGNRVVGALCLDLRQNTLKTISAKTTILATGGYSGCFEHYTGNRTLLGNGHAMAYRAGAKLMDMEFIQFHPTAILFPDQLSGMLVYDLVVELRGIFYNAGGERFMEKYYPEGKEFVPREAQARAIFKEVKEGRGSVHGGIYLSLRHLPKNLIEAYVKKSNKEHLLDKLKMSGVDLYNDGIEIYPASHYTCGGLWIDEKCRTSLKGLYAVGEAGCGGKDGADRLAGNAVTFAYTMGIVAGDEAAAEAKGSNSPGIDKEQLKEAEERTFAPIRCDGKTAPYELKSKIRKIMSSYAFFGRTEQGLEKGILEIERIKEKDLPELYAPSKQGKMNLEWIEALEARNMVDVAETVLRAAFMRTESRGLHERDDCSMQDPKWLQHILPKKENGKMILELEPINDFPYLKPQG